MKSAELYLGLNGGVTQICYSFSEHSANQILLPSSELGYSYAKYENYQVHTFSRIDNRDGLFSILGISQITDVYSNADLLLRAFLKWGHEVVYHIIGDWWFSIWDSSKRQLFIARDHIGHSSLYYYLNNDLFVCSNSLSTLLSANKVNVELNLNPLCQMESFNKRNREVFYKNVYQLPSAHYLTISQSSISLKNYWLPVPTEELNYSNPTDYVEAFREIYVESVKCRLNSNGKTGITVSSGLDSTSIGGIAASLSGSQSNPIYAYTWAPEATEKRSKVLSNREQDESVLASKFCDRFDNIYHQVVRNSDTSIFRLMMMKYDIYAQPCKGGVGYPFWESFEAAQKDGVRVVLNGMEGNFTVSYGGDRQQFLDNFLNEKSFSNYLDYLLKFKRKNDLSWAEVVQRLFWTSIDRSKLFSKYRSKHRLTPKLSIFNREALDKISKYYQPSIFEKTRRKMSHKLSVRYLYMMGQGDFDYCEEWSRHYNIAIRTPTIDKRLIDFLLSIPNEQFVDKTGSQLLYKRSMKEFVPDFIMNNKVRGLQGGNAISVFKRDYKKIKPVLSKFKSSPLCKKWLDLKKLDRSEKMVFNSTGSSQKYLLEREWSLYRVELAFQVGLFFLNYENRTFQ